MLKIISPSYKRSHSAITHKLFPQDIFYYAVRESEKDKYLKIHPNVIAIPEGAVSNIANTRNWILNNVDTEWLCQVDDDISEFIWIYERKYKKLTQDDLLEQIITHFQIAEDYGATIWGMNMNVDPKFYRPAMPYSFANPILGPFLGSIRIKERYDENLPLKEDYDLFLQIMANGGKSMRVNFLFYRALHFGNEGGCQTYRTDEFEQEQKKALQKKWGSEIIRENERNPDSVNMRIRI